MKMIFRNINQTFLIFIIIIIIIIIIILYFYDYSNKLPVKLKDTYLISNDWSYVKKPKYNNSIDGVIVKTLPNTHYLAGEKGAFATKYFNKFAVIGEYTGIIQNKKDTNADNLYLFNLENTNNLAIDGEKYSNELKYVNSYLNIAKKPNVISAHVIIDGLPKVLYVCMRDIEPGEEFLIDYGEEYNNAFLLK
jgi:hypothetical protein